MPLTNITLRRASRLAYILLPFLLVAPNQSFAKLTRSGDRYYFYFGLGVGMGGFNSQTTATINGQSHTFQNKSGWAVNGVTMGLQGHAGFEYRARNHFYVAAEINGNAMFNATVINSHISEGGYDYNLALIVFSQTSSGRATPGGTNAFGGIYAAAKLGWTDSRDALAVYGIIGAGYEFIQATMFAAGQKTSALADVELGGGRIQFGFGLSYYFNQNFGFYMQFLMTSPIHQYSVSQIFNTGGGKFDISKFPNITDNVSYTYFINVGLNIRV